MIAASSSTITLGGAVALVTAAVAVATAGAGIFFRGAFTAQKARATVLEENAKDSGKKISDLETLVASQNDECERRITAVKHEGELQLAEMRGHINALEGNLGDRLVAAIKELR